MSAERERAWSEVPRYLMTSRNSHATFWKDVLGTGSQVLVDISMPPWAEYQENPTVCSCGKTYWGPEGRDVTPSIKHLVLLVGPSILCKTEALGWLKASRILGHSGVSSTWSGLVWSGRVWCYDSVSLQLPPSSFASFLQAIYYLRQPPSHPLTFRAWFLLS